MIKIKQLLTLLSICILISVFNLGCKKDEKPYISPAINLNELTNYCIIQILKPKNDQIAKLGTHEVVRVYYIMSSDETYLNTEAYYDGIRANIRQRIDKIYNSQTGMTRYEISFAAVELYKNKNGEIVINKFIPSHSLNNPDNAPYEVKDVKLIKLSSRTYNDFTKFKQVSGNNYYAFNFNAKRWIYKNTVPNYAETTNSTWTFSQPINFFWDGRDNGSAKYYNQFIVIPKGNGWNGEHKDKDLLLVNTIDWPDNKTYKGTGPLGLYQLEE